ncbi:hypothetical protein CVT24_006345 [Panaeolus cyanescens]|uniref:Cupin type-1 domain-containing protein n=1 Tax=Panaeolus cyanescens TaxID=181874 RepID=A0A409YE69_9AGAR|nr:hypothetical protein CVT24_006345 [Panaeolus cyanescens]
MLYTPVSLALVSFTALSLLTTTLSAPALSGAPPKVECTDSNPNKVLWIAPDSDIDSDGSDIPLYHNGVQTLPQPQRDDKGATILGPHNVAIELQNADLLAPPTTDHGSVKNFKWPYAMSHNRLANGGWARQQNVYDMPSATDIAGVNMRLEAGAIREMHWHVTSEWAYVLKGDIRISTITPEGQVWVGDVSAGDLWYFPAGYPHSIQAKSSTPDGAEFLLIFDEGTFSEDATFLLTDWLAHVPKSVLAKNFGFDDLQEGLKAFEHIPKEELYIFPSLPPADDKRDDMVVPNNTPQPFTFPFSKVAAARKPGGKVKIVDSRTFTVSEKIAAAEVEIEVGGLRELHWHPTQPEWTYFISGTARITLFASQGNAATYDFYPGDVAYIPPSFGHYIENIGNTTLKFLEVLKSNRFQDISLSQWLALTPHNVVKAHLDLPDEVLSKLSTTKNTIVL